MSFFNQFDSIANAKSGGGSNGGYENNPGWYLCKITEAKVSPENHTGAPYIEFYMRTEEDKMINAKLWVARSTDAEKTQMHKNKRIKEFFNDADVDLSVGAEQALVDILGKQLNCAFQKREYIGKDKETNKPDIKTVLNFYYSKKIGEECKPLNESNSIQRLTQSDEMKYQQMVQTWERQNPSKKGAVEPKSGATNPSSKQEDDLPF